jgi:cystathionine beta-lyase/cystathionine gamma-synthase
MKFATRMIHEGQEPDRATGAVTVPISLSSTFAQDGIARPRSGFEYGRTDNPTRRSLEATIASSENARHGVCFASGSAASTAVLNLLEPADEVLSNLDIYGGTYRLFTKVYARYGIRFRFLDSHEAKTIGSALTPATRLIWLESPTNPLLNIVDIRAVAALKTPRCLLVVDNTFATPYLQNPLDLGADLVVHSATKYIAGHSDVIGGAAATNDPSLHESLRFYQNAAGGIPSPFDCFLIQRGLKTLEVRMQKHQANASALARRLAGHPAVSAVFFPGLPEHPGHETAKAQMRGFGAMLSFRLRGGRPAVERFVRRLAVFTFAESLGGVESLACHPATMTHGSIPPEERARIGVTDDLVRLSVGIEDEEDLTQDLLQALA